MIRKLISFALDQPLMFAVLLLLFVGSGIMAFRALPIEAFPDVSDVQVTVITLSPGNAAEEVEKQVTIPIELALSGLPHSVRLFSHTQFGLSYIIVTFDDQVTDYFARQQVAERLAQADLPDGVKPELAPLSTAIGEIYRYRLRGPGHDATELRTIQDWTVARSLKMVPGVADVVSLGGFLKTYDVNVDLARMKAYDVTLQQLLTALSRGNANAGGSYIEQGAQQYIIRGLGMMKSIDDVGNVVVAERNGTPILARDVATITRGSVPRQGIAGQDADDEAVMGIVVMRKGENPSEVLAAVKNRIGQLNASVLPKGVTIDPYYDRTWLIDTTLHTVFKNLIEGALLVALVLLLFLGNFRSAAIVAAIIPLALLAAFIGLRLRGIPANLLSLGAMDFGIIVDGAVIVVENIFRRLTQQRPEGAADRKRTILEAAAEVARPTFFSMLIIIVAHIPIFTLQRHEGRIFAPMAYTIVSALVGSLLFSLTLVPLFCFYALRRDLPEHDNRLVEACRTFYRSALSAVLERRALVIGAAVVALAVSLTFVPMLGSEFLPELNEGAIWVNVALPPGISVSQATRECARIRAILRRFPEVRSVISKSGRPEDGTDPKQINMAELFVDVKPQSEWKRPITKEQLIAEMEKALNEIPGIDPSFSQPIRDNILESISQIDGQIVVKVFGEDLPTLRAKAAEVMHVISGVRGVDRAFLDRAGSIPQLHIEVDRARAARYGLNVADVEDVIQTALGGRAATEVWEGEKHFSVVARLREEQRADIGAIRRIVIDTPSGMRIPLEDVAQVSLGSGAENISREDGSRITAVSVFIAGRDMGSVVADMQKAVREQVVFPPGYYTTWGGEFENQQRAMARLKMIVPISVFLIFVILFHAFGSVRHAMVILLNVPFALIGGIVALLILHIPLSVSAAIGFIALFGQAVLNGVVMVSNFSAMQSAGLPPREAVLEGSLVRMRTVLMTALLAMLGLLPMALSHAIGSEVQRPLAIVIIGGLVSATALTLFVLPAVYLALERRGETADGVMQLVPMEIHQ